MDIFGPIQLFADLVTHGWLGIGKETYLGSAVNFFIYDVINNQARLSILAGKQ